MAQADENPPAADPAHTPAGAFPRMDINPAVLLREMYEKVQDFAIMTTDTASRITSWNAGAQNIFGYDAGEVLGHSSARLFTDEDIARGEPFAEMRCADQQGAANDYRWHKRKDGSLFWADGVPTPIRDDATSELTGFLKIVRDITERKEAQDEISRLATFDSLTGLYNRAAFDARRLELLQSAMRSKRKLLLFIIDLDRFKEVNDTHGHLAGDQLLAQAGSRIKAVSRGSDIVARIGGDEFALLQLDPPTPLMGAVLASKILETLSAPFKLGNLEITVSGSIGIAVFPDDASAPEGLLRSADLALYQAKASGRNCYHYFTESLDAVAHRRTHEQTELKRLERTSNFSLAYQPIIDAHSGAAMKMEALLRMPRSALSATSIEHLIGLAKEIGLITQIGIWVFTQATAQLRQWRDAGLSEVRMAINTCARELIEPEYLPKLLSTLDENGLRPQDIDLELTERDAIEMGQRSDAILRQLSESGFGIVLDDFGTGYSALSYLRSLPVSGIKLDKSFLREVPADDDANAITRAIITLAIGLRLEVVAEGVEQAEQMNFLRDAGCHALQGFLLAQPMSAEDSMAWLLDRGARRADGETHA